MIDSQKIWQNLSVLGKEMRTFDLRAAFGKASNREEIFSLALDWLYLDYSKNLITEDIFNQLIGLAEVTNLPDAIDELFSGCNVNCTENRPALHMACRRPLNQPLMVKGHDVMRDVATARENMANIVGKLRENKWLGATHQAITDVVNIGIGGSDLGPKMATQALKPFRASTCRCHFLSNLDSKHFQEVTENLNPATTLFIIASKSFTTEETLVNAERAKKWLQTHLKGLSIKKHFIAITANVEKAKAWGEIETVLPFWDWVGGRYSVWSGIGLPLAIQIGMENYEKSLWGPLNL